MNTAKVSHPTPPWTTVLREQFRVVGLAVRREFLLVLGLALGGSMLVLVLVQLNPQELRGDGLPPAGDLSLMAATIGLFFPLLVWKSEKRHEPSHIWTLPINHQHHAFVKALAGWGWLIGLLAVALLWLVAGALAVGMELGLEETRWVWGSGPAGAPAGGPEGTYGVAWTTPAWQWVVPFFAATAAYLVGSTFVFATDRTLWWGIAVYLALATVFIIAEGGFPFTEPLRTLRNALAFPPYGLDALLSGGEETLSEWHRPFGAERGVEVWSALPSFRSWATGTLLWTTAALIALAAAAMRHKEN